MNGDDANTLPYRVTAEDIYQFVRLVGNEKSLDQIQTMGFTGKNFVGTLLAVRAIGLVEDESEKLTQAGKEIMIARNDDERAAILRKQLFTFAPYADLLETLAVRGHDETTEVEWFENWWAQAGHGASANNRAEAALALANLLDGAGLGSFIRGRRGHPSRVEWASDAFDVIELQLSRTHEVNGGPPGSSSTDDEEGAGTPRGPEPRRREATVSSHAGASVPASAAPVESPAQQGDAYVLSLPLRAGTAAHVRIPHEISPSEKRRLIGLIELMVEVEEHAPQLPTSTE